MTKDEMPAYLRRIITNLDNTIDVLKSMSASIKEEERVYQQGSYTREETERETKPVGKT